MPNIVYLIPDLLGTELVRFVNKEAVTFWQDRTALLLQPLTRMALAANGANPATGAYRLQESSHLIDLYDQLEARLRKDLQGRADFILFTYDFRKGLEEWGQLLKEDIQGATAAGGEVRIVAHGMGGLIARLAYNFLKDVGQDAKLAKVVTLGTPHYGCYAQADVLSGSDNTLNALAQLWKYNQTSSGMPVWAQAALVAQKKLLARQTINTWPSVYQMGPFLGPVQQANDPRAANFWEVERHATDSGFSAAWVNIANALASQQFVPDAKQMPFQKLKCVAGVGRFTYVALSDPAVMDDPAAWKNTDQGDGVVPFWSASAGSSNVFAMNCEHDLFTSSPIVLEKIVSWLFDVDREPAPPIPDLLAEVPGQTPTPDSRPSLVEIAQRVSQGASVACATGACKC